MNRVLCEVGTVIYVCVCVCICIICIQSDTGTSISLGSSGNRAKSGNVPKSNAVSEIGENLIEKYFHCVYSKS